MTTYEKAVKQLHDFVALMGFYKVCGITKDSQTIKDLEYKIHCLCYFVGFEK